MTMPVSRMFEDLRRPSRRAPGVEAFAKLEAQPREHADHSGEEPPGAAERVVVMVGPAEPEPVLAGLLHPGRRVPRLPVFALGLEDQVARQVASSRPARSRVEQRPRSC